MPKPKPAAKAAAPAPNKALRKVWDGWSTLDVTNVKENYAAGPPAHLLRHRAAQNSSWGEYQKGVVNVRAGFKMAKFIVNDDAEIHLRASSTGAGPPYERARL